MKRNKPLRRDEIQARALRIACEVMAAAEMPVEEGGEPGTPREIRRFLTGKARRELLRERRAKKEHETP